MRFRLQDLPLLALPLLPLLVAYNGLGMVTTLFVLIMWALARQAIVLSTIMSRQKDSRVILETLSVSHYVEKVRWCLDKLDLDYEEEADVGLLGIFLFGRMVPALRIPRKNMVIYNSSDILTYLYGAYIFQGEDKVAFLRPTQQGKELERKIDRLGNDLRCYFYYHVGAVGPDQLEGMLKVWGVHQSNVPGWQKALVKILFPILKAFLFKVAEVTPENAAKSLDKCKAFFIETDQLFNDGRQYLMGTEEPTYLDYSLAALGSLLVLPEKYGGRGVEQATRITKNDLSAEAGKEIDKFVKTPTGKFIIRMYQHHR